MTTKDGNPSTSISKVRVSPDEPIRELPESIEVSPDDDLLGSGGMAHIMRAQDRDLGRELAYKEIHRDLGGDARARRSFIGEAQITAQLDHPNIVPIYEFGRRRTSFNNEEDLLYLTMKRIHGRTLTEVIKSRSQRGLREKEVFSILQIFLKVCDAIAFAHSRGVIHRDIKPDNIMVGDYGEVYVLDWGVALISSREEEETSQEVICGTPCYMSPEQARGYQSETDERSDVFSLGACLYEILTGSPPYEDGASPIHVVLLRAMECAVESPQQAVDYSLPPKLTRIAMKALEADPADRYQSVQELKADIEGFLQTYSLFPQVSFEAGGLVFEEGDEADAAYIIMAGRCEVFKKTGDGEEHLRFLEIGDVFGEIAVFANRPRTASVRAVTEVTAVRISGKQIKDENDCGYWINLLTRALAERFIEKEREIAALEKKLARYDRKRRGLSFE